MITELIKTVAQKQYHCLAISGRPGIGKTNTLMTALKESDVPFCYLNGHVTPYALYKTLYLNRNGLVVLDDLDEIWENTISLSLLKSVLDTSTREVSWLSTVKMEEDIEKSFEFTGSVIIVVNSVTRQKNPHVQALLSRAIFVELNPSRQELLDILYKIENCDEEILQLMADISPQIDLRDYRKIKAIKSAYPDTWKPIALRLLGKDEELSFVYETVLNNTPKFQAITEYRNRFGKSERSYYRKQREVGKISVKVTSGD